MKNCDGKIFKKAPYILRYAANHEMIGSDR